MQPKVKDALPATALLAPDQDLAVVARARQDVAILGVRPRDTPDSAIVPGLLLLVPVGLVGLAGVGR